MKSGCSDDVAEIHRGHAENATDSPTGAQRDRKSEIEDDPIDDEILKS